MLQPNFRYQIILIYHVEVHLNSKLGSEKQINCIFWNSEDQFKWTEAPSVEKFGPSRSQVRHNIKDYFLLFVLEKNISCCITYSIYCCFLVWTVAYMCFYCRYLNITAFRISCIMEFIFPEVLLFILKLER